MNQIGKILIAIDFSEPSLNALDTAMFFAKKHDAGLYLVYTHENVFEAAGISSISLAKNSSNVLAALASDIQRKTKIKPVIIEEEGFVSEIVLKNAVKYKCDLIVMGTYGASGYRSGYIGSNTYSIVKFAPCPVLIIPGGKRPVGFNRPLFPVRPVMASESSIKELNRVVAEIQSNLAEGKIETKMQWSEGNTIAEDILSQADKNNSDLIILPPAIDVSTKQFYIGPIAHRVIHHTRVPILVINKVNIYSGSTRAAAN